MDSIDRHTVTVQQGLADKYAQAEDPRNRRPLHRTPLFWGAIVLVAAVIAVYVFTDALAWLPRSR